MSAPPVRVAVVGHTNTGKTSLLRTLTRDTRFGVVSERPATTRDVQGVALLAGSSPCVELYDTPGLEDAIGLTRYMAARHAGHVDPVAAVDAFLAGDHDQGRYEQEAKVLRQMLRSDAAIYVVDAREPVLATHREELRLLGDCGRPLLPLLNFVAGDEADPGAWRQQLARLGLHVLAEFDTVVLDHAAERRVFEKLGTLLEARRADFDRLLRAREDERTALIAAACRTIADLLVNTAGLRVRTPLHADIQPAAKALRQKVRDAEQRCVEALLDLFRFDLGTVSPPDLPLDQGRWALDPFDPQTLRRFGVRTGSAAAAGGMAGLAVDAAVGGMSLGAAAALGAGLGAAWSSARTFWQPLQDRLRGHQVLALDEATLAVLASRQLLLLQALLRRGHASTAPLAPQPARGWPSPEVRKAALRCRAHPEWSALNAWADDPLSDRGVQPLAAALHDALVATKVPSPLPAT